MARQRHNAAFVVGSMLGGIAGAAAALWKAPQSGVELRSQISERIGGFTGSVSSRGAPSAVGSTESRSTSGSSGVGGKFLSFVENATAPIVGVKLGHTAERAPSDTTGSRASDTSAGERVLAPHESTGETSEAGIGHVASTDELVRPTVPVETQSTPQTSGTFAKFPELEGDTNTT